MTIGILGRWCCGCVTAVDQISEGGENIAPHADPTCPSAPPAVLETTLAPHAGHAAPPTLGPQPPEATALTPLPAALPDLTELARLLLHEPRLSVRWSMQGWTYVPHERLLLLPQTTLAHLNLAGKQGALCREVGRWLYSRGPLDGHQPSVDFCLLWHSIDQVRTNHLILSRHPSAHNFFVAYYRETQAARDIVVAKVTSLAQTFVQHLMLRAMFGTELPTEPPVEEVLAAVMPEVHKVISPTAAMALDGSRLSAEWVDEMAAEAYRCVQDTLWPPYQRLLAMDIRAVAAQPPSAWSAAEQATLTGQRSAIARSNVTSHLHSDACDTPEVVAARRALEAQVVRVGRLETPALSDDARVLGGLVTWEQAMELKRLAVPIDDPSVDYDAALRELDDVVRRHAAQLDQQLDASAYQVLRRRHQGTIDALVTTLMPLVSPVPQRAKQKRQRRGTYDLRRGLQAQYRQQATQRADPRVFIRRTIDEGESRAEFIFCVDCSGSMMGDNIECARAAFVVFHEALEQLDVAAGSLAYNGDVQVLAEVGRSTVQGRHQALERLVAGGDNNEPKALDLAKKMFASRSAPAKTLIILTDGGAVPACRQSVIDLERDTDIRVIGIGIGAGCGQVPNVYSRYIVVPNVRDLPTFMGQCLQQRLTEQHGA